MNYRIQKIVFLLIICILTGCTNHNKDIDKDLSKITEETTYVDEVGLSNNQEEKNMGYQKITPEEAKNLMETEKNFIILDVRTDEEYEEGYINNAILIPDYELEKRAKEELTDMNQLILVYCRSGNRSKKAAEALVSLGYTNVKDFGGILDWPYEITK